MVGEVIPKETPEVALVEDDHVVEEFPPDAPDEPLDVGALPRRLRGDLHLGHAHAGHPSSERLAVDRIAIPEQKPRWGLPGKRLDELLSRPRSGGVRGDVDVKNPSPFVGQYEEDEENLVADRRDGEEVDGHGITKVIAQEGGPRG
jgi:hypothetical protein